MTHTLSEIAAKFARLDGIDDEQFQHYAKGMRNLVQRQHLPPTSQQGRVFLYDAPAAVTIRLAQIAQEFGIPRITIDNLATWLSNAGERREAVKGGSLGVSRASEAVQRVRAGETFGISVVLYGGGQVRVEADWQPDAVSDRARNAARMYNAGKAPELARFTLPASRLIAEILPLLGEG